MLLDPSYSVSEPAVRAEMTALLDGGWSIGVHPSYESWNNSALIRDERQAVEAACGKAIVECRQHWLRLSWGTTWRAQQAAGLKLDTTLGFNDRPGFRNGAALRFHPWDAAAGRPLAIEAMPMVLMDSHVYDYQAHSDEERRGVLERWIGEVKSVGGEASVNWHVHTLAPDYGWELGYIDLLDALG